MAKRISKYSIEKKGKVGRKPFLPDINEWKKACELYPYDSQISKHFDIHKETFYTFLDKQRFEEENGKKSAYLDAYLKGRAESRAFALQNLMRLAQQGGQSGVGDSACAIFMAKTYGGLLESKDIKLIELKKIEVELKRKAFLTDLAKQFNLDAEKLDTFAQKYFMEKAIED